MNLTAGIRAKQSVAYKGALDYLKIGVSWLSEKCWENQYDLTLSLYTELTEVSYLLAEYSEMKKYSEIVLQHAKTKLQKSKIYEIIILYYSDQNKLALALETGISFLTDLGIRIPKHANSVQVLWKLSRTQWLLRGKTQQDLLSLPEMNNEHWLAAMRILIAILSTAYIADALIYQTIVYQGVNLSLKYGNTAESAIFYANFGAILCMHGQVEQGSQLGQISVLLLDKFNAELFKPKLFTTLGLFILPRYEHIDKSISVMLEGIQIGLDTGDTMFAGYLASGYSYHVFFSGKNLEVIAGELEKYANLLHSLGQQVTHHYISSCLQTVNNLLTIRRDVNTINTLSGKWFDEESVLPQFIEEKNNVGVFNIYLCKLLLCYLFYDYKNAYANAILADKYVVKTIGLFLQPIFHFYYSLTCLQLSIDTTKRERRKLLKQVRTNQLKLKRWAQYAPMNYLHKYYLVQAQYAEATNDKKMAGLYYDKAIDMARQNRFVNDEALANELAAKFYILQGKEKIAKIYLNDAFYCYKKWGAIAKIKQIEEQYSSILNISLLDDAKQDLIIPPFYDQFDLEQLMKASEEILREIEIDKLLIKMMRVVVENTGAQSGYYLLEISGEWHIEAEVSIQHEQHAAVLKSLPIEGKLPISIIQEVIANKSPILLEDAAHHEKFAFDDYVKRHQTKSVLCIPLLNQGILSGILYLENNLSVGVFTQDKLSLLSLLSAQIVIAIDNAMLYQERKRLNEAYDRFVPHEFLNILGKGSIIDVKLGDQIQQDMSIMFCNIKDFASISDKMTSQESMNFINAYIAHLEPVISKHNGIIDKYVNDTIMAVFLTADDAVKCAVEMINTINQYNITRSQEKLEPILINIGINSGKLTLGTVGGKSRMEGTVISDAVNIASRVNSLTSVYNKQLLITESTYSRLTDQKGYTTILDTVIVNDF